MLIARFLPETIPQRNNLSGGQLLIVRLSANLYARHRSTLDQDWLTLRSGSLRTVPNRERQPEKERVMKRAKIFAAVIYGMLVMGTIAFVQFPDLQADEIHAKIGKAQAGEAAMRAVPGTVKHEELETEHGRLIYSFEIKQAGKPGITEVNVSAMDGSIVEVHREHAGKRNQRQSAQFNAGSASTDTQL